MQEFHLCVWDVHTGKPVFTSELQSYPITELAFTADHRLLASAGGDRTVLYWDVSGL